MKLKRRIFLRGLGGAAVLAPFLGSVVERAARAQGVSGVSDPRRLIVMFTNNGCITTRWFPANSHGTLTADDYVGSCAGYFKTGQAVNVDDGSADLERGNSEAPCDEDGEIPAENFKITGTPPELANAPINKYYCSLMNAIGVKAGPDGFPLPGGNDEVTHYGMYDRTEDFASGGALTPTISDPGGFEELKANT